MEGDSVRRRVASRAVQDDLAALAALRVEPRPRQRHRAEKSKGNPTERAACGPGASVLGRARRRVSLWRTLLTRGRDVKEDHVRKYCQSLSGCGVRKMAVSATAVLLYSSSANGKRGPNAAHPLSRSLARSRTLSCSFPSRGEHRETDGCSNVAERHLVQTLFL